MRKIKFRAWSNYSKSFIEDDEYLIGLDGKFYRMDFDAGISGWEEGGLIWNELENITLIQFTGLHDKNGKEIYEGDLMRYYKPNSYAKGEDILEVRWHEQEGAFKYWCLRMKDWECAFQKKLYNVGNNKSGAWCEVIGNIYENPELIIKDETH